MTGHLPVAAYARPMQPLRCLPPFTWLVNIRKVQPPETMFASATDQRLVGTAPPGIPCKKLR